MVVTPFISQSDVKRALQLLAPTASPSPDVRALAKLVLVELITTSPEMEVVSPNDPSFITYPVSKVLSDLILQHFSAHWRRLEQPDIPLDAPRSMCFELLKKTSYFGQSGSLIAWTLLFIRFIRSDLGLSVQEIADHLGMTPRNLNRYDQLGLRLLTEALIDAEVEARAEKRHHVLISKLNGGMPPALIGRDALLDEIDEQVRQTAPRHILFSGAAGVGKTLLVEHAALRLILNNRIEMLVWIGRPKSVEEVRAAIEADLFSTAPQNLQAYLQRHPVLVVIDGIDALSSDDYGALDALLHELASAYVFITSAVFQNFVKVHIPVPPLDRAASEALFRQAVERNHVQEADIWLSFSPQIYEHTQGNPRAIEIAASWVDFEDWASLTQRMNNALFERILSRLTLEGVLAWCALAIAPEDITSFSKLTPVFESLITSDGFNSLLRWHLAQRRGIDDYVLTGTARAFIETAYNQYRLIREAISYLVDHVTDSIENPQVNRLVEQCLTRGFPVLDYFTRELWMVTHWEIGVQRGHWAHWRFILERSYGSRVEMPPILQFAHGVCLRRMGAWDEAEQVFWRLGEEYVGDQTLMARSLLELSIISRNRGEFAQAFEFLERVHEFKVHLVDQAFAEALILNTAQTMLEMGKARHALPLLAELAETPRVLALRSDALYRLGEYGVSRTLVSRACAQLDDEPSLEAALYVITARTYIAENRWENAHTYLTNAVNILERLGDDFALARAQTNLALVLAHLGETAEAEMLLLSAESLQIILGDQLGLHITRHNLDGLRGKTHN